MPSRERYRRRPGARAYLKLGLTVCSVPGCGRKYKCKGLCATHYNRKVRLEMDDWETRPFQDREHSGRWSGVKCRVALCGRQACCKGLCQTHRRRERAGWDLAKPIQVRQPDGGRLGDISVPGPVFWEIRRLAESRGLSVAEVHREALVAWYRIRKREDTRYRDSAKPDAWTRREEDTVQLGG